MARLSFQVTDADTALALGSGDVAVLATPRLVAWIEAATVAEAKPLIGPDQTSVGTRVALDHSRATAVGATVTVEAVLSVREGRRMHFTVRAEDSSGRPVAEGAVDRAVVDRQRFLDGVQDVRRSGRG